MCMWLAIVELVVWFHLPGNKGSCYAVNRGLHRRRNVRSCASASPTMSGKHPPLLWLLTFQDLVIFKHSTMLTDTGRNWRRQKNMGNINEEEEIKTDAVFPQRKDKLVTKIPDRNKKGCIYFGSEFGGISIYLSGTVWRNHSLLTGGCEDTILHILEDQLTRLLELRTGLWLTSGNQAIAKSSKIRVTSMEKQTWVCGEPFIFKLQQVATISVLSSTCRNVIFYIKFTCKSSFKINFLQHTLKPSYCDIHQRERLPK